MVVGCWLLAVEASVTIEEERGLYYGVADGTNLLSIVVSRVLLSSSVVARTPRRFKSDADYVPPPWMSVSSWTDT
jgi:hypothetical protein